MPGKAAGRPLAVGRGAAGAARASGDSEWRDNTYRYAAHRGGVNRGATRPQAMAGGRFGLRRLLLYSPLKANAGKRQCAERSAVFLFFLLRPSVQGCPKTFVGT